jgi:flagellar export protein FliJ
MSRGLELVKRLTAIQEREARRVFADAVSDLRAAEANLAALNNRREVLGKELSTLVDGGVNVDQVSAAYRYMDAFSMRVDLAAGSCVTCREAYTQAEAAWMVTRHNLKGMETVCQRRAERENLDRERREQRILDDLYRPQVLGLAPGAMEDSHAA